MYNFIDIYNNKYLRNVITNEFSNLLEINNTKHVSMLTGDNFHLNVNLCAIYHKNIIINKPSGIELKASDFIHNVVFFSLYRR